MSRILRRLLTASVALTVLATRVRAQSIDGSTSPAWLERVGASASLRAGMWTSTHDLDDDGPLGAYMVWGKLARPVNERVSVFIEGWTALERPSSHRGLRGELREGYVTVTVGKLEIRAGRQIIAWGRADGVNPTDNLSGQDLTLLTPDDNDRRLGAAAGRASYYMGDIAVTAIWLPEFRPGRIPLPAGPAAGLETPPTSQWQPAQWALRIGQTGHAVDWSVSAYSGGDLSPDLRAEDDLSRVSLTFHRVRVFGADAAWNVGRYGLRTEAAYVDTTDPNGVDPFTKNPFFFAVTGGDRTFGERLNLNVQYILRIVCNFASPSATISPFAQSVARDEAAFSNQAKRVQHGATLRLSDKWRHDTLTAEIAAVAYAAPHGVAVRPKADYAISDRLKVIAGADFYRGDSSSLFGILRDNSGAYLELRWSF
jgi:hypothetical protein